MSPIKDPYLLCVCVPVFIDGEGQRWTDELWAKDLELHLKYLTDLTIACPAVNQQPNDRDTCLNRPPFDRLKFIDLPYPRSYGAALRSLPQYASKLWNASRDASVIHSGFGIWPFAEGWFLSPIGKLQKKLVVTNVESSYWRSDCPQISWHKKFLSHVMEHMTRFAVRIADLRFFTSKAYAADFLPKNAPRSFVVPATWVNEEWILSEQQATANWDAKQGPTKLIFAGRLIAEKGVEVLLQAVDEAVDAEVEITIIGKGPLHDQCVRSAQQNHGSVSVRLLDPVEYGDRFLAILRGYDAVLLPSLSSEQPRLLFDAFSQSVPVIGSATGGICEVAELGVTGRLVPPGDVGALAQAIVWASQNRAELRRMGFAALGKGREATHRAMHRRRHEILLQALSERAKTRAIVDGDKTDPREAGFRASCAPAISSSSGFLNHEHLMAAARRSTTKNPRSARHFSGVQVGSPATSPTHRK